MLNILILVRKELSFPGYKDANVENIKEEQGLATIQTCLSRVDLVNEVEVSSKKFIGNDVK